MAGTDLREFFADLPDPRVERTRVHPLDEVWVISVLAVSAGADGWDDIVEWGEAREKWLRTFLSLPGGLPSADTIRRVFCAIEPAKFARAWPRCERGAELGEVSASR